MHLRLSARAAAEWPERRSRRLENLRGEAKILGDGEFGEEVRDLERA
jgi:hypothetical protein